MLLLSIIRLWGGCTVVVVVVVVDSLFVAPKLCGPCCVMQYLVTFLVLMICGSVWWCRGVVVITLIRFIQRNVEIEFWSDLLLKIRSRSSKFPSENFPSQQ